MKNSFVLLLLIYSSVHLYAQTDTIPPVVVCKAGINYLNPTEFCMSYVNAIDLIDTVYDDTSLPVSLGISRPCYATTFPGVNTPFLVMLFSSDLEVWAKDAAGNSTFCRVKIFVYDPFGSCDPSFTFETTTYEDEDLPNTKVVTDGWNCLGDTIHFETQTDGSGEYSQFGLLIPDAGYAATITALRTDNPLNGVTSNDLVLIQKHILGIQKLNSPFKMIAADANFDGKITTADIVLLRKLILGLIPELPHGLSWRFVAGDYTFPNPANPFNPPFPDRFIVKPWDEYLPYPVLFRGVKIGDVNGTAIPEN
jgi:hypothetical protein